MIARFICILMFLGASMFHRVHAIEWNDAKEVAERMFSYYAKNTNYSVAVFDQWIKSDGSKEAVGDTVFIMKYDQLGYIKEGAKVQIYTEKYDIHIDNEMRTMKVREVDDEELKEIAKLMPTAETVMKLYELCDSAKVVASEGKTQTVDFFFNHPLINKTRMIINTSGSIKEVFRYYTNPDLYVSQHTIFIISEPLTNPNSEELKQDNYIHVSQKKKEKEVFATDKYKDYNFQLIKK